MPQTTEHPSGNRLSYSSAEVQRISRRFLRLLDSMNASDVPLGNLIKLSERARLPLPSLGR
ncbi:hypothetical protein EMIT0111MI5_280042 [Burkholderia sp. IT-111MI5]